MSASQSVLLVGAEPGSLINFRRAIIKRLKDENFDVHVAATEATLSQRKAFADIGVSFHAIPFSRAGMNPLADVRTFLALLLLIRRIRPLALLAYTVKPVVYATIAAYLCRVPKRAAMITGLGFAFIPDADGMAGKGRRLARLVSVLLYKLALPRASSVLFQNKDDLNEFTRLGILGSVSKTAVVNGSGVDVAHFAVVPLPEKPTFLMIGRLLFDKGVREYVEASRAVRSKLPEVECCLLGGLDPSPNSLSQSELEDLQRSGIRYLGSVEDVRPVIQTSSVVVLPSYREGTPRSVLEGMAMGRAIITTDAPGCRDTVEHRVNGLLVPVRDAKALADAMVALAEDPATVAEMGKESRRLALEKYDSGIVAQDTLLKAGILTSEP